MQPDRLQHDRHDACVFAQQYSSAALVSLRSHFRKNRLRSEFQICYYLNVLLFKNLQKSEIA